MVLERLVRFRDFFFFHSVFVFLALFYIPFLYCNAFLIHCAIFSLSTSSHPSHSPSPPPQLLNHPQPTSPPLIHSSTFSTLPRTLTAFELSIHRLCGMILSFLRMGVRCDAGRRRVKCFKCVYAFQGGKSFSIKSVYAFIVLL